MNNGEPASTDRAKGELLAWAAAVDAQKPATGVIVMRVLAGAAVGLVAARVLSPPASRSAPRAARGPKSAVLRSVLRTAMWAGPLVARAINASRTP